MAVRAQRAKPVRVRLREFRKDAKDRTLIVLGTPRRILPIWIGAWEWQAIAAGTSPKKTARPMTHDLLVQSLADCGWKVAKVVVSDLRENTFYAELHLLSGRRSKVVDCRPSDGVALAVRAKAPIYVAAHVMDAASVPADAPLPEPESRPPPAQEAEPAKRKRSPKRK